MESNSKQLLIVCGPTSTGKTNLALKLAKDFDGEIVSADSRQVYKGMDIGTGKDIPKNSKFEVQNPTVGGFYRINNVRLWGYDVADPSIDFSVSMYAKIVNPIIQDIHKRNKLPILTGGTGLYIKSITDNIETINIPINEKLRGELRNKDANELFEILRIEDPIKAAGLNISDRKNPVRLIRAIEVAKNKSIKENKSAEKFNCLFVGLTSDLDKLKENIEKRIEKRIENGIVDEVKSLKLMNKNNRHAIFSVLGYQQINDYLNKKISLDEAKSLWKTEEIHYAKRQMVWFKRDKRINWFDVSDEEYVVKVESLVKSWHNRKSSKSKVQS